MEATILGVSLSLGALVFLLRYLEPGRRGSALAMGGLLGASVMAKQNFGAVAILGFGIGLLWSRSGSALGRLPVAAALCPHGGSGS